MKMSLAILVLLFSGLAFADANSDAYKAGSSFGKGSASQGTSALKNTDAVSSAIPGYTSNPSEKNYYGGVTGGDSGLSDKGQSALQGSNAGQAVIDASTKNPSPVIDPNAPFITAGKAAESGSESVLNGTSQQCTATTVSKSTFETFTCEHDVWTEQMCSRDATATGSMGPRYRRRPPFRSEVCHPARHSVSLSRIT
jgi:conjugal transfer mating pair stabilization protein TraN